MKRLIFVSLLVACSGTDGADPPDTVDDAGAQSSADAAPMADDAAAMADGAAPPMDDGAVADAAPDLPPVGLEVGQLAPDFELPDQDGELVALADTRGRPTLVVGSSMW